MDLESLQKIENVAKIIKFADIVKSEKQDENRILYSDHKAKNSGKKVYIEVVDNEVLNVFESNNFKNNQERYYKSQESVQKSGDKPSGTNRAKFPLVREDLDQGKKVEIYTVDGCDKNKLLEEIKKIDGRYPPRNFQKNKENIPIAALRKYKE